MTSICHFIVALGILLPRPTTEHLNNTSASAASHTTTSSAWLLSYDHKSTNTVRWNSQFPVLLQTGLSHAPVAWWGNKPLSVAALALLSGPPDAVSVDANRYVTLSACAAGVCTMKGLLWVDTATQHNGLIFAFLDQDVVAHDRAALRIYTENQSFASHLPPLFLRRLSDWEGHLGITAVTCATITNQDGSEHAVVVPSAALN
jgi:hypothetical protein